MIIFVAPHAELIEPRHRCALAPCGRGLPGGATTRMGEGSGRTPSPNGAGSTSCVALSRKGPARGEGAPTAPRFPKGPRRHRFVTVKAST